MNFSLSTRLPVCLSVCLSLSLSLSQISFGKDFEQQLGFFVEARASFSNVDSILVFLIQVHTITHTHTHTHTYSHILTHPLTDRV